MSYTKCGNAWHASQEFINQFKKNPNFDWFVSYPRTGSHWLRMMLELYTERPLLERTFYYPNNPNPLLIHEHDRTAEDHIKPKNVLYIYRNPVDTVFSLSNYWFCYYVHSSVKDTIRYTNDYIINLKKWLVDENFTTKKTIVTYEDLKKDPHVTFEKALSHFNIEFDSEKFDSVLCEITKDRVSKNTQEMESSQFKNRVISPEDDYEDRRKKFWDDMYDAVWNTMEKHSDIMEWFKDIKADR